MGKLVVVTVKYAQGLPASVGRFHACHTYYVVVASQPSRPDSYVVVQIVRPRHGESLTAQCWGGVHRTGWGSRSVTALGLAATRTQVRMALLACSSDRSRSRDVYSYCKGWILKLSIVS